MTDTSFSNFIADNYTYISKNKNGIYYNNVYHNKWNLNYVNVKSISEFNLFGQNKIHSAFYCDKLKVRTGFPVRLSKWIWYMNSALIFSDSSVLNLMHSSLKRLKYGLST